jgi:hypothetical protein
MKFVVGEVALELVPLPVPRVYFFLIVITALLHAHQTLPTLFSFVTAMTKQYIIMPLVYKFGVSSLTQHLAG